jgi:hypothetical protein
MIDFYKDAGGFLEPTHDRTTGDNMKKYIWEVGVDIQTIYLFPEADNADEAEMIAEDEMRKLTLGWEGFDFDYHASSAQIDGVTPEYAEYVTSSSKEDDGVLTQLMRKAKVKSITELEEFITEAAWRRS